MSIYMIYGGTLSVKIFLHQKLPILQQPYVLKAWARVFHSRRICIPKRDLCLKLKECSPIVWCYCHLRENESWSCNWGLPWDINDLHQRVVVMLVLQNSCVVFSSCIL